jgi:hypothetical protein
MLHRSGEGKFREFHGSFFLAYFQLDTITEPEGIGKGDDPAAVHPGLLPETGRL